MCDAPFYRTVMGHKFFDGTLPRLVCRTAVLGGAARRDLIGGFLILLRHRSVERSLLPLLELLDHPPLFHGVLEPLSPFYLDATEALDVRILFYRQSGQMPLVQEVAPHVNGIEFLVGRPSRVAQRSPLRRDDLVPLGLVDVYLPPDLGQRHGPQPLLALSHPQKRVVSERLWSCHGRAYPFVALRISSAISS